MDIMIQLKIINGNKTKCTIVQIVLALYKLHLLMHSLLNILSFVNCLFTRMHMVVQKQKHNSQLKF